MNDSIFNETEYLEANPDVSAAVKEGKFQSGREHYSLHGQKEGRMLKRLFCKDSREEKVFHLLNKKTFLQQTEGSKICENKNVIVSHI